MFAGINVLDELRTSLEEEIERQGWSKVDSTSMGMALSEAEFCSTQDQLADKLCGEVGCYLENQPDDSYLFAKTRPLFNQHSS